MLDSAFDVRCSMFSHRAWLGRLTGPFLQRILMNLKSALAKTNENHLFNRTFPFEGIFDFRYCDPRRAFHRKSVCAGADGWECNRPHAVLFRQRQRISITTRQQLVLPWLPSRQTGPTV